MFMYSTSIRMKRRQHVHNLIECKQEADSFNISANTLHVINAPKKLKRFLWEYSQEIITVGCEE